MRWLIALLVLAALPLAAADVSGKWSGPMADAGRDVVFVLKQEGAKVSGTMSGPEGEPRPITQGELRGDSIALTVQSEWQGSPVKLIVKGTVSGNQMKLSVQSEDGGWGTEIEIKRIS